MLTKYKQQIKKSPLNYIGGKYKLLSQILPLFPVKIDNFVDLFCGGCNVGINSSANKIHFNDNLIFLKELNLHCPMLKEKKFIKLSYKTWKEKKN